MNVYSFMLSETNGCRVAELVFHAVIATSDSYYDRTIDEHVFNKHDILGKLRLNSRMTVSCIHCTFL